jgi:cardiolipin synthase
VIVDDAVYVGSSNLDQRSLRINYELMLRFRGGGIVDEARRIFDDTLRHCRPVTRRGWRESGSFWSRLKQRLAYFLLVRFDPYIARRQWRALPD